MEDSINQGFPPKSSHLSPSNLIDILSTSLLVVLAVLNGLHAYSHIGSDLSSSTFSWLLTYFVLFLGCQLCDFFLRLGLPPCSWGEAYLTNAALCLDKLWRSSLLAIGVYRTLLTIRNDADSCLARKQCISNGIILVLFLYPMPFMLLDLIYWDGYPRKSLIYEYISLILIFMILVSLYTQLRKHPGSSTHPGVDKTVLLFHALEFLVQFTVIIITMLSDLKSQGRLLNAVKMSSKALYPMIYISLVLREGSVCNKWIFPWLNSDRHGVERRMNESRTELTGFLFDEEDSEM